MSDRIALARAIGARTNPRASVGAGRCFTDEQLAELRGGLTAEEYRWKLIKKS